MKIRDLRQLLHEGNKLHKSDRDEYAKITYGSVMDLCDHINRLQLKLDSQELKLESNQSEESYFA